MALSAAKAKKILEDGYVKSKPLTAKQKKYFGAIADGATPLKKLNGGWLDKFQNGGDVSFDSVQRAIRNVESLDGKLMWNPESTATGLYGQLFSQVKDDYSGTREEFAKDTISQKKFFKDRFFKGLPSTQTTSLVQDANDIYNEYAPQISNFNYSKEDLAVLSNFLGRQGTREYLGYHVRDNQPLEKALPNIYGSDAKQRNKTPEQYLKQARKYYKEGGWLEKFDNGGVQPNYNDSNVSLPPGFKGWGYDKGGRAYNGAWNGPVAQEGIELNTKYIDSTFNANMDKRWVQRLYERNPEFYLEGQTKPSTHFMESGDGYVYPRVMEGADGQLKEVSREEGRSQGIKFPNDEIAQWFAKNYKKGTNVLKEYQMGGSLSGATGMMYARTSGTSPEEPKKAQDGGAMVSQYEEPAWYEKAADYLASPMTALGYLARGEDLPDRLPINVPGRSEYDNWNFDMINPAAWIKYCASARRNFEKGEYLDSAFDALSAIPIVPAWLSKGKKAKAAIKKGKDIETAPLRELFTQPDIYPTSSPLPKNMEPYLSRKVYPFNKEQEIFESFLPIDAQIKNVDLKSIRYDADGNIIPNMEYGGEIDKAQWGALLKLAKKYGNKIFNFSKPAAKVDNTPALKYTDDLSYEAKKDIRELNYKVQSKTDKETRKLGKPHVAEEEYGEGWKYSDEVDFNNPEEVAAHRKRWIDSQKKGNFLDQNRTFPLFDETSDVYTDLTRYNLNSFIGNSIDRPFVERLGNRFTSGLGEGTAYTIGGTLNPRPQDFLTQNTYIRSGTFDKARKYDEPLKEKMDGEISRFFNNLYEPKTSKIDFGDLLKNKNRNGGWLSKYENGGVIEDDRGQWAYPGEITKINSNNITMKGVNYPVLGISDTGDRKMMQPGKDYKFKGNSVTEFPMARDGKSLVELNQLTNFTNYNTPQPGGWLDKY